MFSTSTVDVDILFQISFDEGGTRMMMAEMITMMIMMLMIMIISVTARMK